MTAGADPILVFRLSALGDVIHTLPAVMLLRQAVGEERSIGWVVEAPYRDLLEQVAPVDLVIATATKRWRRDWSSSVTRAEISLMREEMRHFSRRGTSIDFQGLLKSAALAWLSGATTRIGFDRRSAREGVSALLNNRRVPASDAEHVVEKNIRLLSALGIEHHGPAPALDWSGYPRDRDGTLALVSDRATAILFPGAGRPEKLWGAESFAIVAKEIRSRFGIRSVVVWGPGERELAAEVVARSETAELAPATNLRELAWILRHARLVVAGDTGPLHLADALGTDVVGIYGPTDPVRNGPYHQVERCVESWSTTRDIRSVSPEAVLTRIGEVLTRDPGSLRK
ncbi:MAG: lipopolysaccharide heptosyltransferase I [Thermoanaerobaculia bacterium]